LRIESGPLGDLCDAIGLLTRLPMPRHQAPAPRSVWAYPVVGLLVGALGGAVYVGCLRLGVGAIAAAIWAVAAQLLLTGALHEDGLADTADGFGGGRDMAGKLAIMRDSRIGAFGAMALVLVLCLRVSAIATRPGWDATISLLAAGASGRAGLVALLAALPPARSDGAAAGLHRPPAWAVGVALLVATGMDLWLGLRTLVASCVACLAIGWLARRQVGGYTGDTLGATEQLAECTALMAL